MKGAGSSRSRRVRQRVIFATIGLIVAALGLVFTESGRGWLHRMDSRWLGEWAMDSLTRLRSDEDWSAAVPLQQPQDYGWLGIEKRPVRIAHALGESGNSTANTLLAMKRSYREGFRLFEVDLVLDQGELICRHDPGFQRATAKIGCTFETLLAALPKDAWLILDIKTDFSNTGRQIVDRLKVAAAAAAAADARRTVFQLYRPEDFALFNAWQQEVPLPGPIVTAYLAHRRIDHVSFHAGRSGARAFTLPLERLPALRVWPVDVAVLVHPVHDCDAWETSVRGKVDGVYIQASLPCAYRPVAAS